MIKRFRFVHDEENTLDDGRVKINTWINEQNSIIEPGSRIVGQWLDVVNSDNAPTIRKYGQHGNTPIVQPIPTTSIEIVKEDRGHLVVKITAAKEALSRKNHTLETKSFKAQVIIRQSEDRDQGATKRSILCLDSLVSNDLDAWIARRASRANYRSWINGFAEERKILRQEEAALKNSFEKAKDTTGVTLEEFLRAALIWRRKVSRKTSYLKPESEKSVAGILKIARAIRDAKENTTMQSSVIGKDWVFVDGSGKIRKYKMTNAREEGFPVSSPWIKGDDATIKIAPINPKAIPGNIITPEIWSTWRENIFMDAPDGIRTPENFRAIRALEDKKRALIVGGILDGDKDICMKILEESFLFARRVSKDYVKMPTFSIAAGYGLIRPEKGDPKYGHNPKGLLLGFYGSPTVIGFHAGLDEAVIKMTEKLYNNPERIIESAKFRGKSEAILKAGFSILKPGDLEPWIEKEYLIDRPFLNDAYQQKISLFGGQRESEKIMSRAPEDSTSVENLRVSIERYFRGGQRKDSEINVTLWLNSHAEDPLSKVISRQECCENK